MGRVTSRLIKAGLGLVKKIGPAKPIANRFMINRLVNGSRERPHPWSTVHEYTSWTSLTDKTWSARHLPVHLASKPLPPEDAVAEVFRIPAGTVSKLSDTSTLLFPAFAQYLTDGFIRTVLPSQGESEHLRLRNTSTHDIDLCTLYGRLPVQTMALRRRSEVGGERGLLKSQEIGGEEYPELLFDVHGVLRPEFVDLDPPLGTSDIDAERKKSIFAVGGDRVNSAPQVSMINVLLLREHNRLAGQIETEHPDWDDTRVFETARNCLILMFIRIVVEEYINHISNAPFDFAADPSVAWDAKWNKPNWITIEFGLLYRWHSLIPQTIDWNGQSTDVAQTFLNNQLLVDVGLAKAFVEMSAQKAGQLGAHNTPASLLHVEIAAIRLARLAQLAPYSAYKQYMGGRKPTSFGQITSDDALASNLKTLYGTVDRLEYYPGLFVEDLESGSPLPNLMLRMVGADAFSQALTNPLLSKHVVSQKGAVFSEVGWQTTQDTGRLKDILVRNVTVPIGSDPISMSQAD